MDEEKVTVDDALIITDIDKLIKVITARKRVSISELEKITGMDRRTVDKWIEALEDGGYVQVEHRITDKNVIWLNNLEVTPSQEEQRVSHTKVMPSLSEREQQQTRSLLNVEEKGDEEKRGTLSKSSSELGNSLKNLEDESAKERVNLIMKKLDEEEGLSKASNDEVAAARDIEEIEPADIDEDTSENEISASLVKHSTTGVYRNKNDEDDEEPAGRKKPGRELVTQLKEKVSQVAYEDDKRKSKARQAISKYMNDINRQKREIESLKHEKERIYHEGYLSLESKAEADVAMLTEKILEKEGRILELKEHILELPLKIEEVEKMRKSLSQIEQEGKKVLGDVSGRVNKFLDEMRKSEATISKRIDEGQAVVETAQQKLGELKGLSVAADRRIEELRTKTSDIELQIDELNKAMRDMLTELEEATEMKVEVTEIENRIRMSVDKKEDELDSLLNDLEEMKKLEQWVSEYLGDYEKKIEEVENYASTSETELDKLKELAEAEHLRKYLKNLDKLAQDYQTEMSGIVDEQQSVDSKIEEAKIHLNSLISESHNLIKKLQLETSTVEEFDVAAGKAKERLEGIRKTVQEKEKERDKLKEDVAKTKKKRKERKEQKKKGKKR